MVTEDDLTPGKALTVRQASSTISGAPYDVDVRIVWVENGHVHYRLAGKVKQTPVDRFLDIVNNPPKERH